MGRGLPPKGGNRTETEWWTYTYSHGHGMVALAAAIVTVIKVTEGGHRTPLACLRPFYRLLAIVFHLQQQETKL